jgi:regulator of PEP synthase PpsR (kinase-PPPase family)
MVSPVIYVVSDSLGETAEFVARAAASQFNADEKFDIRRVPYVTDKQILEDVVEEASDTCGIIAYTLVIPGLKEELERLTQLHNIPAVDIMGPLLEALSKATSTKPKMEAGLLHHL